MGDKFCGPDHRREVIEDCWKALAAQAGEGRDGLPPETFASTAVAILNVECGAGMDKVQARTFCQGQNKNITNKNKDKTLNGQIWQPVSKKSHSLSLCRLLMIYRYHYRPVSLFFVSLFISLTAKVI